MAVGEFEFCVISKWISKRLFNFVQMFSNGHNFFISTSVYALFEALDSYSLASKPYVTSLQEIGFLVAVPNRHQILYIRDQNLLSWSYETVTECYSMRRS